MANKAKNSFGQIYTIGSLTLGKVVNYKAEGQPDRYGHITGFGSNDKKELLIKVIWGDGNEAMIHPYNVYFEE